MPGPIVSGVASFVVPGLGQVLNGKYVRGVVVFLAATVLFAVGSAAAIGFGVVLLGVVMIASAADAYKIAKGTATMV